MKVCSDFRKNCLSFIRVCCFSSGGFCPFMGDGPCYHCCHLGFTFGKAANRHNTVKLDTQIREYTRYTNTQMSWPVHKHISYQCPYRRCHLCTLLSFTTKAAKASFFCHHRQHFAIYNAFLIYCIFTFTFVTTNKILQISFLHSLSCVHFGRVMCSLFTLLVMNDNA